MRPESLLSGKGPISRPGPGGYPLRKLKLVLWIMGLGLLVAQLWADIQGWIMVQVGYPYSTFLFDPAARFSDFTDLTFIARLPNPYESAMASYLPLAWVFLRLLSYLPPALAVFLCLSGSLSGLYLLLMRAFREVVVNPWSRAGHILFFMGTSYPLLFCIDRGNIEIIMVLLVAVMVFSVGRQKSRLGWLGLLLATAFKPHPVLLLALPLRQRKVGLLLGFGFFFVMLTGLALAFFSLPLATFMGLYHRDLAFFTDTYVLENRVLEGSASPWNAYKVGLLGAQSLGLISPVDFSYDGLFIRHAYRIYTMVMGLLALGVVGHVCLVEKEFKRCVTVLLVFLSIVVPSGADYRLLYAWLALVPLILLESERGHDRIVLILLALVMVPKKEFFLSFAGPTETGWNDVSIQVVLNPLFLVGALLFLLYDGWRQRDPVWSRRRFFNRLPASFSP